MPDAEIQQTPAPEPQPKASRTIGVPFRKGGDPRINKKGRPKNFDALRELAKSIADEQHPAAKQEGKSWTRIETILRTWASSSNPAFQKAFVEIAYGRTPETLDVKVQDTTKRKHIVNFADMTIDEMRVMQKWLQGVKAGTQDVTQTPK